MERKQSLLTFKIKPDVNYFTNWEGCFYENVGKWDCPLKHRVGVLFNTILLKSNLTLSVKYQKLIISFQPTNLTPWEVSWEGHLTSISSLYTWNQKDKTIPQ